MSENEKSVEKPSQKDADSQSDEKKELPDEALEKVSGGLARQVVKSADPCEGGEIA